MKEQPLLTDLEDRTLAACDDMYLEAIIAQDVLSSWYGRSITFRELRAVYRKLSGIGLIKTYLKTKGRYTPVELRGHKTEALSARHASWAGVLGWRAACSLTTASSSLPMVARLAKAMRFRSRLKLDVSLLCGDACQ